MAATVLPALRVPLLKIGCCILLFQGCGFVLSFRFWVEPSKISCFCLLQSAFPYAKRGCHPSCAGCFPSRLFTGVERGVCTPEEKNRRCASWRGVHVWPFFCSPKKTTRKKKLPIFTKIQQPKDLHESSSKTTLFTPTEV